MDSPGLNIDVPANSKQNITLVINQRDNNLLLTALQQGKPSCMELTITCQSKEQPSSLSMWVKAPDGSEGRLLRPFRVGEHQFRVQVLAQHTLNFKIGFYLLNVDGNSHHPSRIHIECRHSVNGVGSNYGGGWVAETAEQARDRLLAENRELQLLVEKQKEFILILKRKFLEKGDQLAEKENEVLIQKQKRAKFIINTWRMKTVVPAFQAWRTHTRDRKARKKELLGKVVLRLGNSQLWRSWRTWVQYVESFKVGGLKAALAAEKGKRARQLISAWRMRTTAPVFIAWKKWTKDQKERKKRLMGKVVARIQHAGLYMALRQWKQLIEHDRIAVLQRKMNEMVGADRKKRIESFLIKWRGKTIVPKFQAWRRYAHEHRGRKRILMGKVVLRLGNAKLWSAWRQWRKSIEDDKVNHLKNQLQKHKFARAKQLIATWRLKSLTPAFKAWKAFAVTTRNRKKQLMHKVVMRMQNGPLWAAFRQWSQAAEKMKIAALRDGMKSNLNAQKKRRIQALMARWQKGTVVGTFKRWRQWAQKNRQRKKELLGKVVRRMAQANVWRSFRQWKKFSDSMKLEEMKEKIRNELMSTMMLSGQIGRGSNTGGASGDYQALLLKYRSLKHKKLSLESSYDSLFKFLQKFRVQIARCMEEEIHRLTHHCKCDVCQTKRKMLTSNGINEWFFQFDREIIRFRFPG